MMTGDVDRLKREIEDLKAANSELKQRVIELTKQVRGFVHHFVAFRYTVAHCPLHYRWRSSRQSRGSREAELYVQECLWSTKLLASNITFSVSRHFKRSELRLTN